MSKTHTLTETTEPAAIAVGKKKTRKRRRFLFSIPLLASTAVLVLLAGGCVVEAETAVLQSSMFTDWARSLTYDVKTGPSQDIRYPSGGPYDERLGYNRLQSHAAALGAADFKVTHQAAWSPELEDFTARHGYAVYREKAQAGLVLNDRHGAPLYDARYPERVYQDFAAIPPVITDTLRFIEDRALLDPAEPRRNPAVDWPRLAVATMGQVGGLVDPRLKRGGASTLATQIEKFRHSPDGLTRGMNDKFEQMVAAATRSYLDGRETLGAQQRIVTTYLNATPLSSRPGFGEIIGIGDGLWAWYGTDLGEANKALADTGPIKPRKAQLYRQVLSLLLAQRRPSYYLVEGRKDLAELTDSYLRLLADAGVIDDELRNAASSAELVFLPEAPAPAPVSFIARKAATSVRTEMLRLLDTPRLYDLDRLDLTADTTFDSGAQQQVNDILVRLSKPAEVKSLGLVGKTLLGAENPANISYSVVVYERLADRNVVRVHADSANQPFDLNSGAKLILGSTAKLRTLVTYLDIFTRLQDQYARKDARALRAASAQAKDPLTKWAADYLSTAKDRSLQPMLDAAMLRRYSANPGQSFFTGGGQHVFANFERAENSWVPTVRDALVHSVNLSFIRILRDIRDYYIAQDGADGDERSTYLKRFADQEGRVYLNRFYDDFHGRSAGDILASLAQHAHGNPTRLATLFRAIRPDASIGALRAFLEKASPDASLDSDDIQSLYENYGPDRYSPADRAYIARVHPLQIWLASYLAKHPNASRSEIAVASEDERQAAYSWLFKTRSARKQDVRIRIIREQDAFEKIHADWRKQGYPFSYLVPSLATAIGSSGDRPEALAHLMGLILNDGMDVPTVDVERVQFAGDTPYQTDMAFSPSAPRRVFAPEIARTVKRALQEVVSDGTAARFRGAFRTPEGKPLDLGGKTGTGDNRFKSFGAGHRLIEARAVDRTATFVFYIGDKFYGTVTAYVAGKEADKSHFTSALAVQLLKVMTPAIQPLLDQSDASAKTGAIAAVAPPAQRH